MFMFGLNSGNEALLVKWMTCERQGWYRLDSIAASFFLPTTTPELCHYGSERATTSQALRILKPEAAPSRDHEKELNNSKEDDDEEEEEDQGTDGDE